MGAFHSTQHSGNFGWYIKWNGPFRFGPTGIFGTSFEGLWPDRLSRSVGPKWPFPFNKIVVPSTVLLYSTLTNKNNNQTRGSLRTADVFTVVASLPPECTVPLGRWNFRNCVEWKVPHVFEREFREEVPFFLSTQRCNFKDMLHGTIYCEMF